MQKKSLYGKTSRLSKQIVVTEKLDGSNLIFLKKDGKIHVATRNYIYPLEGIEQYKDRLYKGLCEWLQENKFDMPEGTVLMGEWMGMGRKYKRQFKKFNLFAVGKYQNDQLIETIYDIDLVQLPEFMGKVPVVQVDADIRNLQEILDDYRKKVDDEVEGLIVQISPYTVVKYLEKEIPKIRQRPPLELTVE